jgi:hypothetical protein
MNDAHDSTDEEPPVSWLRVSLDYLQPGESLLTGRQHLNSKVTMTVESDLDLQAESAAGVFEGNTWTVWGDGDGEDAGTRLGAGVLAELLVTLSWWAGIAERKQLALVGQVVPPGPERVRILPMVVNALLELTAVGFNELEGQARTIDGVRELLRDQARDKERAELQARVAELERELAEARRAP